MKCNRCLGERIKPGMYTGICSKCFFHRVMEADEEGADITGGLLVNSKFMKREEPPASPEGGGDIVIPDRTDTAILREDDPPFEMMRTVEDEPPPSPEGGGS